MMDVTALDSGNGIDGVKLSKESAEYLIKEFDLSKDKYGNYSAN